MIGTFERLVSIDEVWDEIAPLKELRFGYEYIVDLCRGLRTLRFERRMDRLVELLLLAEVDDFEYECEISYYSPGRPANLSYWPGDPPEAAEIEVDASNGLDHEATKFIIHLKRGIVLGVLNGKLTTRQQKEAYLFIRWYQKELREAFIASEGKWLQSDDAEEKAFDSLRGD